MIRDGKAIFMVDYFPRWMIERVSIVCRKTKSKPLTTSNKTYQPNKSQKLYIFRYQSTKNRFNWGARLLFAAASLGISVSKFTPKVIRTQIYLFSTSELLSHSHSFQERAVRTTLSRMYWVSCLAFHKHAAEQKELKRNKFITRNCRKTRRKGECKRNSKVNEIMRKIIVF